MKLKQIIFGLGAILALAGNGFAQAEEPVGLFPIEVHGKWGYIDNTGKVVIEPKFDSADIFSEGLAFVNIGEKVGFIDKTGKLIVEFQKGQFYFRDFSQGLAVVASNNRFGYIDRTGQLVIPLQFDGAWDFTKEGLAVIKLGKKYGYIDRTGKLVINPQFVEARGFSEGLAKIAVEVEIPLKLPDGKEQTILARTYGFIDQNGQRVINPQFGNVLPFSEGLAPVEAGNDWGYIDKTGKMVISPQFEDAHTFAEGLARVKLAGRWGFIDKTGKYVINPQFENAIGFSQGLAPVQVGGKWGYINRTGQIVITPQFDYAERFPEDVPNGLARVELGTKWTYINRAGKQVTGWFEIPNFFANLEPFSVTVNNVKKYGYKNKEHNTVIIPAQFDDAKKFSSEGLAPVKVGDKWGFIDHTGKMVISPQFIDAEPFSEGLAAVKFPWEDEVFCGYIDITGKFVIKPKYTKYSYCSSFSQGRAYVSVSPLGGYHGYIDKTGKHIKEPKK